MAQGILSNQRVRLLMSKGFTHYRQRRTGERKRKSVRGCIVGADLATLNLVITKKGEQDIAGLTTKESERPRRLGSKRASKLLKFFRLDRAKDNVKDFVISRKFNRKKSGKPSVKRPKIQRLVTPRMLQHKAELKKEKAAQQEKNAREKSEYKRLVASRKKEAQEARLSAKAHRLSARRSSKKEGPA
jgi:small subunit ribosomal protein S6e